jgi:hypothetical protein
VRQLLIEKVWSEGGVAVEVVVLVEKFEIWVLSL